MRQLTRTTRWLTLLLPLLLGLGGARALAARQTASAPADEAIAPAAVPFGPGEQGEYQVKLGGISVGSGAMEVIGVEMVRGNPTYRTRLRVSGGLPLARVHDVFESWIDVEGLFSRRFKQDQREITYKRRRTYEFYPESRTFRRSDNGETGELPTDRPLDDVSFLYYVRTLPLKVGDTYTIHRYFKDDGNPVVIRVLRKETVEVPAGTFETVVVQPIIKTDGLFGEGGQAEVFFTDDSRRILVQLRSRVPIIGSLSLHLRSYEPGKAYVGSRTPGPTGPSQ